MGATYKNNIELTIFGESHGKAIGITIGNLPSGIQIDLDEVSRDMKRRAPGQNKMSTARKEADQVEILSGLQDGITTGAPLTGVIYNSDQHSKDYSLLKTNMRPGHSDYPAYIKYKGFNDVRGGGHFSGRITAPIVFAGNIAKQILKQKGIIIGAHILSIGKIKDEKFPVNVDDEMLLKLSEKQYPTIKEDVFEKMEETILKAKENLDSVGGKIECVALHVPAGVALDFAKEAVKIAPVYYVTGNHEASLSQYDELKIELKTIGVIVLEDEAVQLKHDTEEITLIGLSDPDFTIKGDIFGEVPAMVSTKLNNLADDENSYTILLSHRPELFESYVHCNIDLVLSGHAHGGQFRLPFIGGLIAPNQGLFPQYDAGLYTSGSTNMIVSRGLGNSIIPIRFNNRPEVVVIELLNMDC